MSRSSRELPNLRRRPGQLIRLRGHDEVVALQALDGVGPPGDSYLAPFGGDRRVMALLFSDPAHLVGKIEGGLEVLEVERPLQPLDVVTLDDAPRRHFSLHPADFLI